jgi:hypothetical protein
MPPGKTKLTAAEKETIRKWIAAGAKDGRDAAAQAQPKPQVPGGAGDEEEKKAETPQEAFKAAVAASEKDDWKVIYDCQTEDSRETFVGSTAVFGCLVKELSEPHSEAPARKSLEDVLKKHGLPDKHMEKHIGFRPPRPPGRAAEGPAHIPDDATTFFLALLLHDDGTGRRRIEEFLKPIKDRRAFVADAHTAMKTFKSFKGERMLQGAELEDLKVNGDSATGLMVYKREGKELRLPIGFKKIAGSWKIDLRAFFFRTWAAAAQ